jgi:hypothetical protein
MPRNWHNPFVVQVSVRRPAKATLCSRPESGGERGPRPLAWAGMSRPLGADRALPTPLPGRRHRPHPGPSSLKASNMSAQRASLGHDGTSRQPGSLKASNMSAQRASLGHDGASQQPGSLKASNMSAQRASLGYDGASRQPGSLKASNMSAQRASLGHDGASRQPGSLKASNNGLMHDPNADQLCSTPSACKRSWGSPPSPQGFPLGLHLARLQRAGAHPPTFPVNPCRTSAPREEAADA